jgi:S1-C subfamily serine protease
MRQRAVIRLKNSTASPNHKTPTLRQMWGSNMLRTKNTSTSKVCAIFVAVLLSCSTLVGRYEIQDKTLQITRKTDDLVVLFKDLQNTVVTVWSEIGHGTGFIVDNRGLIVTNQHVVGPSEYIAAQFDPNTKLAARLLVADPAKDVAVLWINLQRIPTARAANIASVAAGEESVVEGERVFTIGSPLSQRKIITTGIASKIESRAIISDLSINPGNSGGPLFNSLGQVVGITTFHEGSGPGLSGIVRIEEALPLIEEARRKMAELPTPSSQLLPVEPSRPFPLEAIKASLNQGGVDLGLYSFDQGDYLVSIITPLTKYQTSEGRQLSAVRQKEKRNQNKPNAVENTIRPLDDLRNWAEYGSAYTPVIQVRAKPKLQETFLSALSRGLAASKGYYSGPATLRYKTDFYRMTLSCGSAEVEPINPFKVANLLNERSVFINVTDATYEGFYTYSPDAISPECGQVVLDIYSEKDPNKYTRKVLDKRTVERVWADFAAYRGPSPTKAVLQSSQSRPVPAVPTPLPDEKPTTLLTIKRVFVESFGEENTGKALHGWIVSALSESGIFVVTENKDRADAFLKRDVLENASSSDGKANDLRYAFRLVSKEGDILWNVTQDAQISPADVAKLVVAKLITTVDSSKTSPAKSDFNGTYSGDVVNTARGTTAKFEIQLREVQGAIYGCSAVERPLVGSGGFRGTLKGNDIAFEAEGLKNRIQFTGKVQGDEIKGSFSIRSGKDVGYFNVKRASSAAPPVGYDPAQCRKD